MSLFSIGHEYMVENSELDLIPKGRKMYEYMVCLYKLFICCAYF